MLTKIIKAYKELAAMCPPDKLNGHRVAMYEVHDDCTTVLVKRGEKDWVVATWWPELGSCWMWGHYHTSAIEAQADYYDTGMRNAKR